MKDLIYNLISTSWFKQLKNGKVLKFEVFYIWMSLAAFLVGVGTGHDGKLSHGLEYTAFYYIFLIPMLIGWTLRVSTFTGWFKVSKQIEDAYWETQLMRFMDPRYKIQREIYGPWQIRLGVLKSMWYKKYDQSVEFTRANAPWILRDGKQVLFLPIAAALGLILGYVTA